MKDFKKNYDIGRCGQNCSCCDFGDGTAPIDHDDRCEMISSRYEDPECDCGFEAALERAKEREQDELR